MRISDWSSDVCSSDLPVRPKAPALPDVREQAGQREDRHGQRHVIEHCQERHGKKRRAGARGALQNAPEGEGQRPENQSCPFHFILIHHRIAAVQPHETLKAPHWEQALRSEEHTSELQSLMRIPYAVFCLKKKKY